MTNETLVEIDHNAGAISQLDTIQLVISIIVLALIVNIFLLLRKPAIVERVEPMENPTGDRAPQYDYPPPAYETGFPPPLMYPEDYPPTPTWVVETFICTGFFDSLYVQCYFLCQETFTVQILYNLRTSQHFITVTRPDESYIFNNELIYYERPDPAPYEDSVKEAFYSQENTLAGPLV